MYRLAIFDLDGTLVNSVADLAESVNFGLKQLHYPTHPLEDFYHYVGNGVLKLCQRALPPSAAETDAERLLSLFNDYYAEHCLVHTRPYEGMPVALAELQSAGLKLAVASNKTTSFSQTIVTHLFSETQFAQILGGNEIRPKKPSPEILFEIMEVCGVTRAETVMIGDSDVDIQTSKNAGIDSIGCVWGFRGEAELKKAGASYIAQQPTDLPLLVFKG